MPSTPEARRGQPDRTKIPEMRLKKYRVSIRLPLVSPALKPLGFAPYVPAMRLRLGCRHREQTGHEYPESRSRQQLAEVVVERRQPG